MSEECLYSFPVFTPNGQKILEALNTKTSDETFISHKESFQVGQQVQFLKVTLQNNGKISYKETFGNITCIVDEFAEIEDYLGDVIRCRLSNIKRTDSTVFGCTGIPYLNAI